MDAHLNQNTENGATLMRKDPIDMADDRLAEEAALWVARMQSADATAEDHQAFQCWLEADAAHKSAYDEMQSLWGEMKDVQVNIPKAKRLSGSAFAVGAIVLCLFGLASFFMKESGMMDRLQADYHTSVGETRVVTLDDGTVVSLNTDAAIKIGYTENERRIVLLRGEAFFEVAKNPRRPFVVQSGSLTAKALGTHYSVRSGDASLPQEVQVEEGEVQVETPDGVTRLTAGDAVTLDGRGKFVRSKQDVAINTAWRDGKLIFSGQSLGQVLKVLERYRHGRIVILDDRAASLSVSGIFDLNDTDQALQILEGNLPVTVARVSGLMVFVRAR